MRDDKATRDGGGEDREPGNGDEVTDRICAALSEAIAEGALRPGTKLSEELIAEHFGVSRTVVRGALAILGREHLVERRRNRGAFVAEPTVAEARHLFDARRALEQAILERALPRAPPAELGRLEALTREEERIHQGGDGASKSRLSGQFHVELAKLADNSVLQELLAKVVARISLVMAMYDDQRQSSCGAEEHRRIIEAIRRGDRAGACREMDEHLQAMAARARLDDGPVDRFSLLSVLERYAPRSG